MVWLIRSNISIRVVETATVVVTSGLLQRTGCWGLLVWTGNIKVLALWLVLLWSLSWISSGLVTVLLLAVKRLLLWLLLAV